MKCQHNLVPKPSLAMDPELAQLDWLLEDDLLFQRVKANLARRYPNTITLGRPSTPVEVILRMLVVKRLYPWSYEETEHFVSDSIVLRQFCRLYLEPVPDDPTLIRWAHLIGPESLRELNARVVELAWSLKVTRGRKLRVDSMVVPTNIHHPTDSGLLEDRVRVLSRLLRHAKIALEPATHLGREAFPPRTRSIRRLVQQVHRLARRQGEEKREQMQRVYRRLIRVAQQSLCQGVKVQEALMGQSGKLAQRLVQQLDQFLPLVEQAISQTQRRVLDGERVAAQEKVVSLFEQHTQIIVRHKAGRPVEFGRKVWLDEVDGGIISRYVVLEQAGQDHPYLKGSIAGHKERFGKPPWLPAGDRGVHSRVNELLAKREGVKRFVVPYAGKGPPERLRLERQSWFRRGYRFRAGIAGHISVLRRCYGLERCLDHGEEGMGRWVWSRLPSSRWPEWQHKATLASQDWRACYQIPSAL
jgi:IS5 family transposase